METGLSCVRAFARHGVVAAPILMEDDVASSYPGRDRLAANHRPLATGKDGSAAASPRGLPAAERPFLVPCSDGMLEFVCDHRSELEERFALAMYQPNDTVQMLNDKALEAERMRQLGFDTSRYMSLLPVHRKRNCSTACPYR